MAQKNRADLTAVISTNLADNTVEAITPLLHREVEDDLKDSCYNLDDDGAEDVKYTPLVSADWNLPIPTNVAEGLDQIAERVEIVEAKSFYREKDYVADTQDTVSASFPITGIILNNTLSQQLSPTTLAATWGYSINGGQTWIEGLTIGALNTVLVGINTLSTSRTELRASMTNIVTPIVWEGQLTVTLKNINA